MDTKKLAVFQEAIKNGSLKKTAEKLNYTQSGLIYMMNSLEDEFGIHLLNRTTKGIELTQEGILLEPYIKKIVDCEEELTRSSRIYIKRVRKRSESARIQSMRATIYRRS